MMRLLRPWVGRKPPEEMPDTVRDLFENERRLLTSRRGCRPAYSGEVLHA
jgi:hypothetical protein